MALWTLASTEHLYGFEGTTARTIFIGGFASLVLVAALVAKISLRHWLIAGALFATALTAPVDPYKQEYVQTWLFSVQMKRAEIHLGFGVILTVLVLLRGGFAASSLTFQGVLLLIMSIYAGALQTIHKDASEAGKSIVFAMMTIPCMLVVVPQITRDFDGVLKLLKAIMWVSVAWTFCCSVQFVLDPQKLVNLQGRFWGMLANAQQAAVFCAPIAVIAIWLLLNDTNRRSKVLWISLIAINLLFLAWTGSRTGAVMFLIGATFVLYSRIGKAVALLPIAGLMLWGLFTLAVELKIYENLERLVSTENTRQGVWANMFMNAMENPLVGVGFDDAGGSENSYLLGFASYGVVYFMMTVVLFAWSALLCWSLLLNRRFMPKPYRTVVDLFIGFNAMYFAGAMFEGYMLGRSSTIQLTLLTFAGLLPWIRDQIAIGRDQRLSGEHEHEADDEHALADEYGQLADASGRP